MTAQSLLQRYLEEEFGLKAPDGSRLAELVQSRTELAELDDNRLAATLSADAPLRRRLAAHFSVGESYFFRHEAQNELLISTVTALMRSNRPATVWSAGCSRGEEPYTIAVQLLDRLGQDCRRLVSIVGTDIDDDALQCARTGRFAPWSMRATSAEIAGRFFRLGDDGSYQLAVDVLGWPQFHNLSIQEHLASMSARSIDVVLFRNVGIYLTPQAVSNIHAGFASVLRAGGLLLQSLTDPMPPESLFAPVGDSASGAFRLASEVPVRLEPPPRGACRPEATSSETRDAARDRVDRSHHLDAYWRKHHRPVVLHARPAAVAQVPVTAPGPAPTGEAGDPELQTPLANASALANSGHSERALQAVSQVIQQRPTAREAYVLRAQLQLQLERPELATADLRAALLLDPSDCLTRYWYVVALESSGDLQAAAAQKRVVAAALRGRAAHELLGDGVTTVAQMRALVMQRQAASR